MFPLTKVLSKLECVKQRIYVLSSIFSEEIKGHTTKTTTVVI